MTAIQGHSSIGRDFQARELAGKRIRIRGSLTRPHGMVIAADEEYIANVGKIVLIAQPDAVVEVKLELCHLDQTTEEITLRDNLEVSISVSVPGGES